MAYAAMLRVTAWHLPNTTIGEKKAKVSIMVRQWHDTDRWKQLTIVAGLASRFKPRSKLEH